MAFRAGFDSPRNPTAVEVNEHSAAGDNVNGRRFKATQIVPLTSRFLSNASVSYYGYANPGTATSAAAWRIFQDDHGGTQTLLADGNDAFDNVWDNASSLTYS